MCSTAVAFLCAALPAQNITVQATVDGCCDLRARFERLDRLYLVLPAYESALTVLELGDASGWWWSYVVPPNVVWRDGAVERVSVQAPVALRVPVDLIPPGTWYWRVGTVLGYSDTLTIRVF